MISLHLKKQLQGSEGNFVLDVKLTVQEQMLVAVTGPSGAGKTSLLKLIAGLLKADNGYLHVDGEEWYNGDKKSSLAPQERSVGFVFQDYALFPNMSVKKNLEYALSGDSHKPMIDELLALMQMSKLQNQMPHQLSGGQQQRVALARAIVRRPKLLLLDEPFAALDPDMRAKLRLTLSALHRKYKTTTIMVSHNANEIAAMAEQVVRLESGKITNQGEAVQVLKIADASVIEGMVVEINPHENKFIVYSESLEGLWRFDVPTDVQILKGDKLKIVNGQPQVIKNEK